MRRERRQACYRCRERVYSQRAALETRGARERWQHEHPAGDHVGFAALHRDRVGLNERGRVCRERELWNAAACLGLDGILRGGHTGCSV
jgi:hypothetical protein